MSTPLDQPQPENITFSYNWVITDFSQKPASSVEHPCLTSCIFPSTSSSINFPVFRLSLFPRRINAKFTDYLSIGFGAISLIENDEKITVRYRMSLINNQGERLNTKEWLYIFSSSKRVSVFGQFINRSELFDTSNGFVFNEKLVIHCEGTVLGEPSGLDYANTNLSDLKFIAKSQPDLMVEMLYNLATKNRLTYYSPSGIPNFEIQNQVEETFSYFCKERIFDNQFLTWSQSKYMKCTMAIKLLSHREMLDLLRVWMVSGKHSDLSLVFQGDQGEKLFSVHKIIIQNRSSAFDVLLQQNSRVSIGDVPFEVFDQLIHYIYTGKVPLLRKYQYELLNVSCEYDFDLLNQMSQLSLCDEISNGNVVLMLILANEASADLLKRACFEYITDHAIELMFELDSLKPDLIEELYRKLAFKNRHTESDHAFDQKVIPNFAIQNQVDKTFSYSHIALYDELLSHSAWSNVKYNTRSTHELMQLSRGLMLDTLCYWMNSGMHVDLSLVLGHGDLAELWNLHSIVLFNRSSAFDALLHNNTIVTGIEEQTKRVFIADAPIEVFDQLIQYLYTGKVPLLKDYHYELLTVSCEYGFDVLKQMFELAICDKITTENAINILIMANIATADLLKQSALDYALDHATELMFDHPDSLEPELIEEMYRNLALKNVLYESEDRKVYENFLSLIESTGIEESLSYTHLKMYHIFNEFTFQDYDNDHVWLNTFESPEFCAAETPIFKFKLQHVPYKKNRHFFLLVKDLRRYDSFKARESYFCYKMSLCLCLGNESYETLAACDGFKYFQLYSGGTRVLNKLSLQNRDKLDNHYSNRNHAQFLAFSRLMATFKICSEITVLCDILEVNFFPIRGLSQLELEQSRKHLFECINSLLLKSEDDKRDVTLDICGAEMKVHKLFLTQSPVLEAIIFRQSKRIHIPDLSIEPLEKLIQYLYTGKVQSLSTHSARELWPVANKFQLEILVQMCQLVLNLLPPQWSANGTCRFKLNLE